MTLLELAASVAFYAAMTVATLPVTTCSEGRAWGTAALWPLVWIVALGFGLRGLVRMGVRAILGRVYR